LLALFLYSSNITAGKEVHMPSPHIVSLSLEYRFLTDSEILYICRLVAVHLDTYYRTIGGSGLRLADIDEDHIHGILLEEDTAALSRKVIFNLAPWSDADDENLLSETQSYIQTPTFWYWMSSSFQ
jgi:hypothetical protein